MTTGPPVPTLSDRGLICVSMVGGTMGDVRPLVGLALGLRAHGFEILLLGDAAFEASAVRAGVAPSEWFTYSQVPLSFSLRTTAGQRWLWGERPRYRDRWMRREVAMHRMDRIARFWRRAGGPQNPRIVAAIGSISAWGMLCGFGPHCAKIVSTVMPYQPSRHFTLAPPDRSPLERLSAWWRPFLRPAHRRLFCEELFHLVCVSPSIFPRPDDWLPNMQVTGNIALEDDHRGWSPPRHLRDFLDHGAPAVYAGFGSYPFFFGPRGEKLAREIIDGCRRREVRCIIQSDDLPRSIESDDVLVLEGQVPHAWLFPRCAAIVHHGGYGTLHAALAAGRPMVVYPFQTDQFLWATRTRDLGVGPGFTARLRDMSAARLASDLASALRDDSRARAEQLGAAIAADRGLTMQVAAVESIIEHTRRGMRPLDWRLPVLGD